MIGLSVSNLAWPAEDEAEALALLAGLGVTGVEVAPTRVAPWEDLTPALLAAYRARIEAAGLAVSSLQAVLFGRPEPQLLGDETAFERLCDHTKRVADIAVSLGGDVLVFGAPRNRQRGNLAESEAWRLARDRLPVLGGIAAAAGTTIGIEPVPPFYGCDFLTSWRDVLTIVQQVDHPGVRVHLDTGCIGLAGDSIAEAIAAAGDWLLHFHAAQPELGSFDTPTANHAEAAAQLHLARYDRWIAIEMRQQPVNPLAAVELAVITVSSIYPLDG